MSKTYLDQMHRKVTISTPPNRIISLVPSLTELLFDLGVGEKIIGRTKFCYRPKKKVQDISRIGGTKKFHFDKIQELEPNLIIGNKEENYKEGILELEKKYPVWMSDISTLSEAYEMIFEVGRLVGKQTEAQDLIQEIQHNFEQIKPLSKRVLYFVWQQPYMVVGQETFIDEMLQLCGFENLSPAPRYPQMTASEIKEVKPDLLLLSSEPFPFKEKHRLELAHQFPESEVVLVDGEFFSWYGSRLRYAGTYFQTLLEEIQNL